MFILGISSYYHDSAACLLRDGVIVGAAQEERFTRVKHDPAFPLNAVKYCLAQAGVSMQDVDYVAFYDKPFLKFDRLIETYIAFAPRGFASFRKAMPVWLREKLFLKDLLIGELANLAPAVDWAARMLFGEHHLSHAASAFYPSPFESAAVLTLDGVGEWATSSLAVGRGNALEVLRELHFPHSLGLLYSAFTYYAGFKVNSGEYKLMGLAPYGQPTYAGLIREHLIDVKDDGSFRLNMDYFDYCTGLKMVNARFEQLFGGPARLPHEALTTRHMDLAASIQQVTEDIMLRLTRAAARTTGLSDLCLAGGVALNCVANGKLLRDGAFKRIWVQPAAGDAGGALGAALSAHHGMLGMPRTLAANGADSMRGSYLGPSFSQQEINASLSALGAVYEVLCDDELVARCAADLADGQAAGWFQGRMEFGPRALGGRSILGDPRRVDMQKTLNLKIKFRESFRPFAPSVLAEDAADWFDIDATSAYMLMVAEVKLDRRLPMSAPDSALFGIDQLNVARSQIPAVTHVDYSARIQTVDALTNPRYHALLTEFKRLTGCPLLVNTSFNVRGEPIVCEPGDAFRCFMGTGMDVLAIGNAYLRKSAQDPALARDYQHAFAPD
ncbi:carbamoyltransferase family protein [Massilia sp. DWR3-1-1]|uniref:carbamoyltransferase family protein n=1 Tax=Massilia sp. DWR3-1-1 TaxID=2804559 RepID=UPI003CFA66CC